MTKTDDSVKMATMTERSGYVLETLREGREFTVLLCFANNGSAGRSHERVLVMQSAQESQFAEAQSEFVHHPVTTRLNAAKTDEPEFASPA